MGDNNRNMILALVLSALVLVGWTFVANRFLPAASPQTARIEKGKPVALPQPGADPAADGPAAVRDRAVVLAATPRVRIETPRLAGSINLRGARIDDLVLPTYRETLARNAPPIRLLSPGGSPDAYFAEWGWAGSNLAVPGADTVWTADGALLAPGRPVTLSWTNPSGLRFRIRLSVDDSYMFTVEQSVGNGGTAPATLRPYALVSRVGPSKDPSGFTMHTGPIGTFGGSTDYGTSFKDLDKGQAPRFTTNGGWLGFGDKYWLAAIVGAGQTPLDAGFRKGEGERYQADAALPTVTLPPGKAATVTSRFFAGAKEVAALRAYERQGVPNFDRAIDWGWFYWFEQPIFWVLDNLFKLTGNFGVAIILLTCIVRGLMFPIAQRQFRSMAGMRVLQPKMKLLQDRYKDDKPRLQQEMMKLYQEEKVNPLAGCLPVILQIPIFYALYKVLMVTIEMRHQPFVLWIKDLSAPDPMTPINLFGFLPFEPTGYFHLGVLAILLGITMWGQFKLNPQPMEPSQAQVMALMPWFMMFLFAPLAAGLQLYYVASNIITIAQQKWLYSRHPVLGAKPAPTAA